MSPQTRKRLLLLGMAGVLCCTIGLFFAYRAWDAYRARERQEMLRVTLIWGRLAPLPKTARDFTITKEGSMFTRSFRASFTAPVADVERWLHESPGTRDVTPSSPSPSVRHFDIAPGDGAQHAEVTFDESSGVVRIYVFWS